MRQAKTFRIPPYRARLPLSFAPDKPWLAPLAGYSDLPFRLLCRQYGASVCETEMISVKGLLFKSPGTSDLLASLPRDEPLVVQLFGSEPESMGQALLMLRNAGYRYFDCNMGCPVRKVLRQKAGAALMADPHEARKIASALIAAAHEPAKLPPSRIGFKIRLGLAPGRDTWLDIARYLEDAGADWITLHPRYASQGYGGSADWEKLKQLVDVLNIPVIGSGDLITAADGLRCIAQTGAATIMYARGALHNPFIFQQHIAGSPVSELSRPVLNSVIRRHIRLTRACWEERRAFIKIRSIIPRYARFLPGVGELRKKLGTCASWESLMDEVDRFFSIEGVES